MRTSLLLAAAFLCFNLSALDFPDIDTGRGLASDKIYPQGRIFPFSGFQPPDVAETRDAGFTMAGPAYGTRIPTMLEECKKLDFPVIYPLKPRVDGQDLTLKMLSDPEFKPDWEQIKSTMARDVKAAMEKYPRIAWWYLTPEELRFWRANEFRYLQEMYQTIRDADPQKRPVWMYIPGHYSLDALVKYVPCQDIIGKGMYVNYSNHCNNRVWARWSSENQITALKDDKTGKFAICVPEMFQDQPDGKMEMIESRARHDVYLSLACGSRGVVIFSLARRRTMDNETHRRYFDAYKRIARELTGPDGLGQVFLFGERRHAIKGEVISDTPAITIRPIPGRETEFTYTAVAMTELLYRGARYLVTVNSAETATCYRLSAIPANVRLTNAFHPQEELTVGSNGAMELTLAPLETKIIKITPKK